MVEKFKKILEDFKEKGGVSLFAILKMDDLTDKWSVLVCASWIDSDEKRREAFILIRELIKKYMTNEEASNIARIGVMARDQHIVQELLENKAGEYIGGNGSVKINGNVVHEAYILESNKNT